MAENVPELRALHPAHQMFSSLVAMSNSEAKKRFLKHRAPAKRGSKDTTALSSPAAFLGLPFLHVPQLFATPGLFGSLVVCVLFAHDLQLPRSKITVHSTKKTDSRTPDVRYSPDPYQDSRPLSASLHPASRKHSAATDGITLIDAAEGAKAADGPAMPIDSYCTLKVVGLNGYKTKVQRTCTRRKTAAPRWDEVIQFNVLGGDKLEIEIHSRQRIGHSSILGVGSVSLHDLLDGAKHDITVSLLPAGTVNLRLQFFDESCLFGLPLVDVCAREVCFSFVSSLIFYQVACPGRVRSHHRHPLRH